MTKRLTEKIKDFTANAIIISIMTPTLMFGVDFGIIFVPYMHEMGKLVEKEIGSEYRTPLKEISAYYGNHVFFHPNTRGNMTVEEIVENDFEEIYNL